MPEDSLKQAIRAAFADVECPPHWCLKGSHEGDEPFLVEQEFADKTDWRILEAAFLDQSPDDYGTSLSFFSDEAFRFYLPAYLLADIDGLLERQNPAFHLTHGLLDEQGNEPVNERRYGARTWFEQARYSFSTFTPAQAAAIVAYLQFKATQDPFYAPSIQQALDNYWLRRDRV